MKFIENSDGESFIDTETVANAAIKSCFDLLINIGFSHEEIGKLFLMASHDISEDAETVETIRKELFASLEGGHSEEDFSRGSKYAIFDEMDKQAFLKKLEVLGKRLETVHDVNDAKSARKVFELIQSAIPLRLQLIEWVRGKAASQGFKVQDCKFAWRETASDQDLMNEDEIFFLDDELQYRCGFRFNAVYQVSRYYEKIGNRTDLLALKNLIDVPGLILESAMLTELDKQISTTESFEALKIYLQEVQGPNVIMQSELIGEFEKTQKTSLGTHLIQEWLQLLDAEGLVKRYKASGRWRIEVLAGRN